MGPTLVAVLRPRSHGADELATARRAFQGVGEAVERAKEALSASVPTARSEGRPAAEALLAFEAALREATERMEGWREPTLEREWRTCRDALEACLRGAERLRLEAPTLDFEALVLIFGDLIAPLDAFEDARRSLRRPS